MAYTLEVSSPGLDRVLRTPAHFSASPGKCVVELKIARTGGGATLAGSRPLPGRH